MNDLKIFINEEFGEIKVAMKNNKEYIEAIAVANILGYSNPRDAVIRHCEVEGVVFLDTEVVTGIREDGSEIIQTVSKNI